MKFGHDAELRVMEEEISLLQQQDADTDEDSQNVKYEDEEEEEEDMEYLLAPSGTNIIRITQRQFKAWLYSERILKCDWSKDGLKMIL